MKRYTSLKQWREQQMKIVSTDHQRLNKLHDELIRETVKLSMNKIKSEWGSSPTHFAFFIMGSGGRFEQSVWSDQDHGIIFEGPAEYKPYFLKLGEEVTRALYLVGYEYCDGNVMASNPLWCKSIDEWKEQILKWIDENTLESLRYFTTFFDSRVVLGEKNYLSKIKKNCLYKVRRSTLSP